MDRDFALSLGKLILAAAWADGCIQDEELEILDNLIINLPDLSEKDRAILRIYMEYPISEDEHLQILSAFKDRIKTSKEKDFALDTIKEVLESYGDVTSNEQRLYEEIKKELDSKSSSIIKFGKSIRKIVGAKSKVIKPDREKYLDEFITNPIYFSIKHNIRGETRKHYVDIDLKKISIALAIMVGMSQIDAEMHSSEIQVIRANLIRHWRIKPHLAESITLMGVKHMISKEESMKFSQSFAECSSKDERMRLYTLLMDVLKADGKTHQCEVDLICAIGEVFDLDARFIESSIDGLLIQKN